jgi:hypothetical protein
VLAVLVTGAIATVVSGEYRDSWMFIVRDFGETALGLVLGFVIANRRSRVARHPLVGLALQGWSGLESVAGWRVTRCSWRQQFWQISARKVLRRVILTLIHCASAVLSDNVIAYPHS